MVNRVLMWAAASPRLQRQVTENPVARRAAHRFVAGERLDEALDAATALGSRGIGSILDLLGEGVTDLSGADAAVAEYEAAAKAIAARGLDAEISIKLSQLGQTVDRDACVANLDEILGQAEAVGVPVEIDMEDSSLVPDTLAQFREVATAHPRTRLAVQAALRRTPVDLETLAPLRPRVRLVKGAYAEPIGVAHQGRAEIRASSGTSPTGCSSTAPIPRSARTTTSSSPTRARPPAAPARARRSTSSSSSTASAATSSRNSWTAVTGSACTSRSVPPGTRT
jgi:Proline dehydrogenase